MMKINENRLILMKIDEIYKTSMEIDSKSIQNRLSGGREAVLYIQTPDQPPQRQTSI